MGYPSDLTESQYAAVADIFAVGNYGKSREHPVWQLLNAVFYLNKTGCQWRMLPNDFPPYTAVESFYRRARQSGKWEIMLQRLVEASRVKQGRNPSPSYSLIDSQSVKTSGAAKGRGIDGGKKSKRA
jgi:putative transposase